MILQRLHEAIAAIAPIDGVAGKQGSIRIDFQITATQAQKDAVNVMMASFDYSDTADTVWQAAKILNKTNLFQAATKAISNNDTFLALASPSNAQTVTQVKSLTQQITKLIKFVLENN